MRPIARSGVTRVLAGLVWLLFELAIIRIHAGYRNAIGVTLSPFGSCCSLADCIHPAAWGAERSERSRVRR